MAIPAPHDVRLPLRPVAAFLARLVLWYAALAVPWPGLPTAYATAYCAVANTALGDFGRGEARFRPVDPRGGWHDVEIGLRRQGATEDAGRAPHDSRVTGYLPAAELAALVLASPIPWSRRLRALASSQLVLHAFLAARLWIMLAAWFSQDSPWKTMDLGDAMAAGLARATEVLVVSPTPSFLVPILVWIPVTFRRADLAAFASRLGAKHR
jgi:hypothetical protein